LVFYKNISVKYFGRIELQKRTCGDQEEMQKLRTLPKAVRTQNQGV